jgi:hypothetical protein
MTRSKAISFVVLSALGWMIGGIVGISLMMALGALLLGGVTGMAAGCAVGGGITTLALARRYPLSRRRQVSILGSWVIAGVVGAIVGAMSVGAGILEFNGGLVVIDLLVFPIIGAIGGGVTAKMLGDADSSTDHLEQTTTLSPKRRALIALGWAIGAGIGGTVMEGILVGSALLSMLPVYHSLWFIIATACCPLPGGLGVGGAVGGAIGSAIMAWQLGWMAPAPDSDEAQEDGV